MIFSLTDSIETFNRDGIHYLYANTDMFGELKLGDLMMYSTLLRLLKSDLITRFPNRFNESNLYFILNRVGGMLVKDIRSLLSLFPSIWKDCITVNTKRYNITQCLTGGNLWAFKCYLESCGISLTDYKNVHILDPSNFCLTDNKRTDIYVMPVTGKRYNVERNMSAQDIIRLIRNISHTKSKINLITKDSDLDFRYIRTKSGKDIIDVNDSMSWVDIILTMMSNCRLYISGDCGFTHLVSVIKSVYKPEMVIYYNTNEHYIERPTNIFDSKVRKVNFKPYSPYKSDVVTFKKNI